MARHCILVVEDDAPSRRIIARRLRREGWLVREAYDGPTALAELSQNDVSAVLLDIGLPNISGIEVLKRIREKRPIDKLPVIMVTAFDEEDHLAEALEAGANDYINKPVNFSILRARLRTRLLLSQAAIELQTLKDQQELILDGSTDGLWEWDVDNDTVVHSERWLALLGLTEQADRIDSCEQWLQRIHPDEQSRVRTALDDFLLTTEKGAFRAEYRIARGDGRYQWILTRGAAQRDPDGRCLRCAGTHTDISSSRYFDRFTGLPNLQKVTDELNFWLCKTSSAGEFTGLVLLRFAFAEHLVARMKIRGALVNELAESFRQDGLECKLIGTGEKPDHLILIVHDTVADAERRLMDVARNAVRIARNRVSTRTRGIYFRVRAGAAISDSREMLTAEEIISGAAMAAHDAFVQGCDVVLFDERLREAKQRRQRLSAELPPAIDKGEIQPWWQPIMGADNRLAGFEVLARWRNNANELILPNEFIDLTENAGLMPKLTEHLIDTTLAKFAALRSNGLIDKRTYVAVNIPPSLLDPIQLPKQLKKAIERHALCPGNLCVEVTESSAIIDYVQAQQCFQYLANAGFKLALDDFGTGYSSLNTLHLLPFDILKIDQSFVFAMDSSPDVRKLVHAIIAIARALEMTVVAEGIETEQQASLLLAASVDRLQGYGIARPMPEEALEEWLQGYSPNYENSA